MFPQTAKKGKAVIQIDEGKSLKGQGFNYCVAPWTAGDSQQHTLVEKLALFENYRIRSMGTS